MNTTPEHWSDIEPAEAKAREIDLSKDMTIIAPLNEEGERCPWPWEPQQLVNAPIGQYHCGYCGAMVLAGVPHIDYGITATDLNEPSGPQHTPPPQDLTFVTRVMEIFSLSHADISESLMWTVMDGVLNLHANVSDVFEWGCADSESITPAKLHVLESAYQDLRPYGSVQFTPDLYAARVRGKRSQGAAYPKETEPGWYEVSQLFDACGPERETGPDNPKKAPAHLMPVAEREKSFGQGAPDAWVCALTELDQEESR